MQSPPPPSRVQHQHVSTKHVVPLFFTLVLDDSDTKSCDSNAQLGIMEHVVVPIASPLELSISKTSILPHATTPHVVSTPNDTSIHPMETIVSVICPLQSPNAFRNVLPLFDHGVLPLAPPKIIQRSNTSELTLKCLKTLLRTLQ